MPFVSRKVAAADLGLSRQRLEKLIKQGRIVETADGVDLDQARETRETMLDSRRAMADAEQPAAPQTSGEKPARKPYNVQRGAAQTKDAKSGDLLSFNDARTARERANASLAELKFLEQSGRLVSVDDVRAKEFEVARKLRDRILGFPAKIQALLPPDAMQMITEECELLIRELQDDAARIAEPSNG